MAATKKSVLEELDIPFSDIDEDALVEELTAEELEELNQAIDPENALLPVHQRQDNQTTKVPTGPYNREKLLGWLEEQAKNAPPPNPDQVEYEKKVRGTIFQPKNAPRADSPVTDFPEELADVLDTASEEDIMELAAILGVHGMLTQKQSRYADDVKKGQSLRGSGLKKYAPDIKTLASALSEKLQETFSTVSRRPPPPERVKSADEEAEDVSMHSDRSIVRTKHYKIKKEDMYAVNELDLAKAMDQLKSDDPELTILNVNNHKDVTPEILSEIADCLTHNKYIKELHLANTRMNDTYGMMFVEVLRDNKTLESLNLESNFLTGDTIKELINVLVKNTTLTELRIENQCAMMGYQVEDEIAKCLEKNRTILKLSLNFENRGPRVLVDEYLIRNNDAIRAVRYKESEASKQEEEVAEEEEDDE